MSETHSSGTIPLKTDTIRTLEVKILNALNSGGGGGGGGGSANYYANYGGGTPNVTPSSGNPFAYDTSTGALWIWNGSAWISVIA